MCNPVIQANQVPRHLAAHLLAHDGEGCTEVVGRFIRLLDGGVNVLEPRSHKCLGQVRPKNASHRVASEQELVSDGCLVLHLLG